MTRIIKVAITTVASNKVINISIRDQKAKKEPRTSQHPVSAGQNLAYWMSIGKQGLYVCPALVGQMAAR
jgi:hypothetical protein